MKIIISTLFLYLCSLSTFAQSSDSIRIEFPLLWENEIIELPYTAADSTTIDIFKCYVSHIEFWNGEILIAKEKDSYHLLDAEEQSSLSFDVFVPKDKDFNSIKFQLGIDSLSNVSGVFGGDLDPTKGMFWTWNSGYINFKLEGSHPKCNTRKNRFHFHLGGYLPPFQSVQDVSLSVDKKEIIRIGMKIDDFLKQINLVEQNGIMMPGEETVILSEQAKLIFHISDDKE